MVFSVGADTVGWLKTSGGAEPQPPEAGGREEGMSWVFSMKLDLKEGKEGNGWASVLMDAANKLASCIKNSHKGVSGAVKAAAAGQGSWPEFALCQGPWDYTLERYDTSKVANRLVSCREGRFFGAEAELRWQLRPRQLWAVFICDCGCESCSVKDSLGCYGYLASDPKGLTLSAVFRVVLWGEKDSDGVWREGRIPRDLAYPISGAEKSGVPLAEVRLYAIKGEGSGNFLNRMAGLGASANRG